MIKIPNMPNLLTTKRVSSAQYNVRINKSFSHLWNIEIDIRDDSKLGCETPFRLYSFAKSRNGDTLDLSDTTEAYEWFLDGGRAAYAPEDPGYTARLSCPRQFNKLLIVFFNDVRSSIAKDIEEDELSRLRNRVLELEQEIENLMECTKIEIIEQLKE